MTGINKSKHVGGRPPKYKTLEEMQAKIDAYFKSCEGEPILDGNGDPMLDKQQRPILIGAKPVTVTGLALALEFATRKSLLEYQAKQEFVNAITRAKTQIEEYAETRLFDRDGVQGAKFTLINNFKGWGEKQPDDEGEVVIIDDI